MKKLVAFVVMAALSSTVMGDVVICGKSVETNAIIGTNETSITQVLVEHAATNEWVYSTKCMIECGVLTNVIQRLAKEGYICAVLGHNWRNGRPGEGDGAWFADYHPSVWYRTCRICGICESKSLTEWK
jgi:hypothetical protein